MHVSESKNPARDLAASPDDWHRKGVVSDKGAGSGAGCNVLPKGELIQVLASAPSSQGSSAGNVSKRYLQERLWSKSPWANCSEKGIQWFWGDQDKDLLSCWVQEQAADCRGEQTATTLTSFEKGPEGNLVHHQSDFANKLAEMVTSVNPPAHTEQWESICSIWLPFVCYSFWKTFASTWMGKSDSGAF